MSEVFYLFLLPQRQQFLEQALRSVTIDITQVLKEAIEILKTVDTAKSEEDVSKQLQAIENVLEYIDQIDIANGVFCY